MRVPNFVQRWVLREQYAHCHSIAHKICWLGFDNDEEAQQHLDRAKDELYSAASRFEELRNQIK